MRIIQSPVRVVLVWFEEERVRGHKVHRHFPIYTGHGVESGRVPIRVPATLFRCRASIHTLTHLIFKLILQRLLLVDPPLLYLVSMGEGEVAVLLLQLIAHVGLLLVLHLLDLKQIVVLEVLLQFLVVVIPLLLLLDHGLSDALHKLLVLLLLLLMFSVYFLLLLTDLFLVLYDSLSVLVVTRSIPRPGP